MGGKTRLMMRTDLKTDLRTTTEITDAELDRAIERAVSDLSRFLPREKTYEESLQFTVSGETVTMPADTSTDAVVKDEVLNLCGDGSTCSIAGQPDVHRPLVVTITDANNSLIGLTVDIYGADENGVAIQETFCFTRMGSKVIIGKKYFRYVYMVYTTQVEGAGPGDVLDVGYGAYTGVWVSLANKPIKWGSEKDVTDVDANALTRNTDFYIDYMRGKIKAISGGGIVAGDTVTISYTKGQLWLDVSDLPDLIKVDRVEYPVGSVPQTFVQHDIWGDILSIAGGAEQEEQSSMAEDKHIRVYYSAEHQPPNDFSPGSVPEFLENTVILAASAYALFTYALKQEIAAETQLSTVSTRLTSADTAHAALDNALENIKKYLDNNSSADAVGLLAQITTDIAGLRTAIVTALRAADAYLDAVAGHLTNADTVRTKYISTKDYVDGGSEPDILQYLTTGDALLNTNAVGGEGTEVMESYRRYAETVKSALVGAFENDRAMFLQDATARTNAALAYVQGAAQRLSNLRSYIEQSAGYAAIASLFAREADTRVAEVGAYLRAASAYVETAAGYMAMADRFRAEAIERRNEAWGIWRDRKQYIGDYTQSSMKQLPSYAKQ